MRVGTHQVPEPVGQNEAPDRVGRIASYSNRIWALTVCERARLQRACRGDRDGGLGYSVRATEADRTQGRRRKVCWDLQNFHQVPEPVGRKKTPVPVARIT